MAYVLVERSINGQKLGKGDPPVRKITGDRRKARSKPRERRFERRRGKKENLNWESVREATSIEGKSNKDKPVRGG